MTRSFGSIGIHPSRLDTNPYIARNVEILGRLGHVRDVPRARVLFLRALGRMLTFRSPKIYDVLILNWAEQVITQRGHRPTLRGMLDYRFLLWLSRLVASSVVYVRHNRVPHDVPKRYHQRVKALIEQGQGRADAVVALCPVYAGRMGYHFVPHPLYDFRLSAAAGSADEFIVFGRIQRYKKIDALVAAWSVQSRLAVIGPCDNDDYLATLAKLANDKPVTFDVGFQEEAEVVPRISRSRGVIIVNDPESLIISGTFFYALSCGVRVLALGDNFLRWVREQDCGLTDYVTCFESIKALADSAGQLTPPSPGERERIRSAAESLFGDDRVVDAWRAVLSGMEAER